MTEFSALKRTSNDITRLQKEIEKINNPEREGSDDERFWKITRDKAGNGAAVIRFLPTPPSDGDALPWVRYWDHYFTGPSNKVYYEKSLTTLNKKDPVSDYNSALWKLSDDDRSPSRKQARDQKRRLHYVSAIYVVSDPGNPANEGKVFLYRYGKRIFDKIQQAMSPPFDKMGRSKDHSNYDPSTTAFNPFDLWKGANFSIRIRMVDNFPNYDSSIWEPVAPLFEDDNQLEQIWKSEPSLKEVVNPSIFKSYEELKERLNEVLEELPPVRVSSSKRKVSTAESINDEIPFVTDDDEDDDLKQFKALAG